MKTTKSPLLIPFLLVMAVTLLCKVRAHDNTTWELLQAVANRIPLYNPDEIREWNARRYYLWDLFRTSTSPEIPSVILDINDQLTQWEYLNSRIDMIGLFLFGPENGRSIIHSVRAPGQPLVDDLQCLKRFLAFANICNHAVDKAAIKEALAFACGLDRINYVVNVENPTITRIAPAPVRDSEEHCERVSVEGISRKKLGSFAKMYHVLLEPSNWWWNDEEAQICVH
ncbi:asparaginyl endopeptidase 1, partial [Tanacetum coccineum]